MTYSISKIADLEDRATGEHTERYKFEKAGGKAGFLNIRPSKANDPKTFKNELLDHGALLPAAKTDALNIAEEAARQIPKKRYIYESKTGWCAGRAGFVLPRGYIGKRQNVLGVKAATDSTCPTSLRAAGSEKSWRNSVSELCRSSSTMMTAVCAAFAAPLLEISKQSSFGICFTGPSRSGKTIATLAAASAIGIRDASSIMSWTLTENFLGGYLPISNDQLLPIDDLMSLPGNDKKRYEFIRHATHLIAQGQDKKRHPSFSQQQIGNRHWRCVVLTSSEIHISALASKAGMSRSGGETFRFVDIPVAVESSHIFDGDEQAANPKWRTARFKAIAEACEENHGAAFEAFIKRLMILKNASYQINKHITFFKSHIGLIEAPLAGDMANRFGLLYAAGMLAIKFKTVTWNHTELLVSIIKSYAAACTLLPDEKTDIQRGRKVLGDFIRDLPTQDPSLKYETIAGYKAEKNNQSGWLVKCDAFRNLFQSEAQHRQVLDWLIDNARIQMAGPGKRARLPRGQFEWADKQRRRSYRLMCA